MQNIIKKTEIILLSFIALSLLALTLTVVLQVTARFIFQFPTGWTQDVIRISFIYLIFLSVPILMKKNEHISIDILLEILPDKISKYVNLLSQIFLLAFFIIFTYSGIVATINSYSQLLPYLNFSMSYVYISIPIAGFISIIYTGLLIVKTVSTRFIEKA